MKVAIFGAGTMGSGIAQVFAAKGHTALMYASSTASAQKHSVSPSLPNTVNSTYPARFCPKSMIVSPFGV